MSDVERARELFADRSEYIEGVGLVGPAFHEDAVQLLKDDPDEYFRLSRLAARDRSGIHREGNRMSDCPHPERCTTLASSCDACCQGAWPAFHGDPKHPMAMAVHPGHVWECTLCAGEVV